ncbi:hypothetical protein [Marimonas lutisalis]|uniref:hypothetical protein n=1 Tax=Marimonas lutisalis TaxID=2545756 RepID=UPI0010F68A37|nr:hypothetical protein [Marimonas lutisalis]
MWRAVFLFILWTGAAMAQDALSGPEFDALTRGKTYYFGEAGRPYGAEEYLDDQRVRWSFLDGKCKEGHWYEEAGLICFVYEDEPEPHCWSFAKGPRGLIARFMNDPAATELYEVEQSDKPMLCLGPEVGV